MQPDPTTNSGFAAYQMQTAIFRRFCCCCWSRR